MICDFCLDGWHGKCLRTALRGQSACGCSICALPLRATPSAPKPAAASTRRHATRRAQKAYVRVPPQSDGRRSKLPHDHKHAIAEALLARAADWNVSACIRRGGYRAIANECEVTYEQVRTVQRNLLQLGRASLPA